MHAFAALALAGALASSACSGGSSASDDPVADAASAGTTVISCTDNATHPAALGVLVNNTWNKASAGDGPWRQCLQSREKEGRVDYGWSWKWPSRDGLYAYPEVLVGRSPWNGTPTNDTRFPRSVAQTRSLTIDYDVESSFEGKKNLAAEFWFTDADLPAGAADPRSIKAELMIWTEASDGLVSAKDKPAAIVDIDGVSWAVYVQRNWGDASGASAAKWTLISYHAQTPTSTVRYDARKFFQDAIDRGLIEARYVVAGVELGNEIVSGSGSTWIKKLKVDVQ
ncbi:MAG: glycoside hydrolase family 12 domain protein [Rhizobacter sp.]|nr:glycoside hydrolase family 12 domain protein [Rhizobacter sp.]